MEILKTLNLNATLFYQFGVFILTYLILSPLLFKPYLKAYLKRAEMTTFSETTASQLLAETKEFNLKYDVKAREINDRISEVFSGARAQGQHESDEIVRAQQKQVEAKLAEARAKIETQVSSVRAHLNERVADFGAQMARRLLGKEA
jgi:F0F1-type ATP synthase membrane subunit b/b'